MNQTNMGQRTFIAIIADDDTLNGFALTGIQLVKDVPSFVSINNDTTKEELERHINVLASRKDIAIVFIADFAYPKIREWIKSYKNVMPCFLEIPSRLGPAWRSKS